MRKAILLFAATLLGSQTFAQHICGAEAQKNAIIAKHPGAAAEYQKQIQGLQERAEAFMNNNAVKKTTAASPIPVIFHFVLDSGQFLMLGGTAGIKKRCDSQIIVINRDFNRQNPDSTLIPAAFKSLYANVGIRFGLARRTPTGTSTPGYEIKIISGNGFSGVNEGYPAAKHAPTGLNAWDVTKYLNVWCINPLDMTSLLGVATPRSFVPLGWAPEDEIGVCLNYLTVGKRTTASEVYISGIDKGRTLTHELGHFFEVHHIWGDDPGCPATGGQDDGFADTPPQADATYGSPTFPRYDACVTTGNGIMFMNYMDYTNDGSMQMFTKQQAALMASHVATGGQYYSLTQNPTLLTWPAAVTTADQSGDFQVYPNPSYGLLNVALAGTGEELKSITVLNVIGQTVKEVIAGNVSKEFYSIDISGMNKGIYMVRCNFASGSVTRKILLQ